MSKKIIVNEQQFKSIVEKIKAEPTLNEIYPHTKNCGKIIPITETNARRLIDRHTENGFAIVSACRGECTAEENIARTREMISIIRSNDFSYTLSYGGFIENKGEEDEREVYERSCIIYAEKKDGTPDPEGMYMLALQICRLYNQDSVLVKTPGNNPQYIRQDGSVDMVFNGDIAFNDLAQIYFTDLHKNTMRKIKGGLRATRFSFTESYISPKPQCYSESHTRHLRGEVFIK